MNAFEEADARISAALSRKLGEPVTWRPMTVRAGGTYTVGQGVADAARPVRDLVAIITWKDTLGDATPAVPGGLPQASAALVVDFESSDFPDSSRPRKGDRLELPDQKPGERLVEVTLPGHDDAARFLCGCTVVPR